MTLWGPREESLILLGGALAPDAELLEDSLERIKEAIDECHKPEGSPRVRLTGLLLSKAHRLGIGAYSMMLDCLGQEAGALMRVLQEIYELLTYVLQDPSRVDEIIGESPPKAGAVAKAIDGSLKPLREYFNQHASHVKFSAEAMGHLIDVDSGNLRTARSPGNGSVLQANLVSLNAVLNLAATEALLILNEEDPGSVNLLFQEHEESCRRASARAVECGAASPPWERFEPEGA